MWLLCTVVVLKYCFAFHNDGVDTLTYMPGNLRSSEPNYNQTCFHSLENYQVNATPTTESQYPWIARVSHSRTSKFPHICTAVCISERIFITAVRCIYSLKVIHTSIVYDSMLMSALSFVLPSKRSKQSFDDIGFIVTEPSPYEGPWNIIELFSGTNRTDNDFNWFTTLDKNYGPFKFKVIGYALEKGMYKLRSPETEFNLFELDIVSDISLCNKILTVKDRTQGFKVPCYHSCNLMEFNQKDERCHKYHGVEGGAVIDTRSNRLIGIATWGTYFPKRELPVGYSVVNSDNFFSDYTCARRIRDDNTFINLTIGYYQSLCNVK